MKMFNRRSVFRVLVEIASRDEIPAAKDAVLAVLGSGTTERRTSRS